MKTFLKDPDSTVDYAVDWSDWLVSDTISTSTWLVQSGITKDSDSSTDTVATIFLSGGTVQQQYVCTNRIVTAAGRTADRSIKIKVVPK